MQCWHTTQLVMHLFSTHRFVCNSLKVPTPRLWLLDHALAWMSLQMMTTNSFDMPILSQLNCRHNQQHIINLIQPHPPTFSIQHSRSKWKIFTRVLMIQAPLAGTSYWGCCILLGCNLVECLTCLSEYIIVTPALDSFLCSRYDRTQRVSYSAEKWSNILSTRVYTSSKWVYSSECVSALCYYGRSRRHELIKQQQEQMIYYGEI